MKKYTYFAGFLVVSLAIFLTTCCLIYKDKIGPVSNDSTLKEIVIEEGSTYLSIGNILKTNNLIKSEKIYKLYVKLMQPKGLKAGIYMLSEDMGVDKIIKTLETNATYYAITFVEGLNMRSIAKIISEKTNNSIEDVYGLANDDAYLDELIAKYWFITDEIKNDDIYYALEGYLFPDTYQFINRDIKVREIFDKMLDNMASRLKDYKEVIGNSKYTVHELLSLASLVELEAQSEEDRYNVAGVFYNRLNKNWKLDSDVSTYYGVKVNIEDRDLTQAELNEDNAYNTRHPKMMGKLPVGPICNPSITSIKAVLEPTNHEYYYFVSDINYKMYFNESDTGHQKIINELKRKNLWFR